MKNLKILYNTFLIGNSINSIKFLNFSSKLSCTSKYEVINYDSKSRTVSRCSRNLSIIFSIKTYCGLAQHPALVFSFTVYNSVLSEPNVYQFHIKMRGKTTGDHHFVLIVMIGLYFLSQASSLINTCERKYNPIISIHSRPETKYI